MFSKKIPEALPEEDTAVWSCVSGNCKGWMRTNFVFADEPVCPLCGSGMQQETRMLPVLMNSTKTVAFP
ncbi:cold-shock protein [Gorillibacterium sp. sgz500922]|uniref:cold-shock protein n=1 Tax=Gorillibacterium sp. sgz500922 TaxID=3446694 RepID=UPI003F676CBB